MYDDLIQNSLKLPSWPYEDEKDLFENITL